MSQRFRCRQTESGSPRLQLRRLRQHNRGTTTPAARNIISGNFGTGVAVDDGGEDNIIQGTISELILPAPKRSPTRLTAFPSVFVPPFLSEDKQLTIPPTTAASNTTGGRRQPPPVTYHRQYAERH